MDIGMVPDSHSAAEDVGHHSTTEDTTSVGHHSTENTEDVVGSDHGSTG
jgi:hypothetical protein